MNSTSGNGMTVSHVKFEQIQFEPKNVSIVKVDLMEDGSVKVAFYGYYNGELETMKVMRVDKNTLLRGLVRGTHPEMLFFDCRVGAIMKMGGFWILDIKKISLSNVGEDYEDQMEFLSHVEQLEVVKTAHSNLANILPATHNIPSVSITGETICCDEDLELLATFPRSRTFAIDIAENSTISYNALIEFLKVTQLKKITLRNFQGKRKSLIGALYVVDDIERFEFGQTGITVYRTDGNVIVVDFGKCLL